MNGRCGTLAARFLPGRVSFRASKLSRANRFNSYRVSKLSRAHRRRRTRKDNKKPESVIPIPV